MLTPAASRAQRQLGEASDQLGGRLQCLRCGHDFKPGEARLGLDGVEGWRPLFQSTGAGPALDLLAHAPPAISGKTALREGVCVWGPQGRKEWGPTVCVEENKTVCLLHLYK